jgi:hypothetical protein
VLHHPDLNVREVDTNMHERLMISALGEDSEERNVMEKGCTSSTSGCGGMGGASHCMSLWQRLSRGVRTERGMLDDGQWRR